MPSAIALFVRPNDNERMLGSVLPNREQRERDQHYDRPTAQHCDEGRSHHDHVPFVHNWLLGIGRWLSDAVLEFRGRPSDAEGSKVMYRARKHRVQLKGRLFRLASPVRLRCLRALWCSAICPGSHGRRRKEVARCSGARERAKLGHAQQGLFINDEPVESQENPLGVIPFVPGNRQACVLTLRQSLAVATPIDSRQRPVST